MASTINVPLPRFFNGLVVISMLFTILMYDSALNLDKIPKLELLQEHQKFRKIFSIFYPFFSPLTTNSTVVLENMAVEMIFIDVVIMLMF